MEENMRNMLKKFLCYLVVEEGYPRATIEAYRLDMGKWLIPFLYQRGISEVMEVPKVDI
jgi:site-specific recombinase XerD